MGTTVRDILVAARAKISSISTSRDSAEDFLEHKTAQPFEKSPISKRDGFDVNAEKPVLTSAFGITGEKEGQFTMIVRLGHAPFGTDDTREDMVQRDVARLADILEVYVWPTGVSGVWFIEAETDKSVANWWISRLRFKVVYTGAVETS